MTSAEAANHLGLSNFEDLEETVEMTLFQCRQELIQKADHVLLFPAKEKRFILLQTAAETLGYQFEKDLEHSGITPENTMLIEERFQQFQSRRSHLLQQLGQVHSFHGLISIQQQLSHNYVHWASFWKGMEFLSTQDVKLSSVLDSMRFLQVIHEWKNQGIETIDQLNSAIIPVDIQGEILRLQQVCAKLS